LTSDGLQCKLVCMTPTDPHNSQLAILTRRYAAFSRSAGGLSSVLGGILVLITYFVGALAFPESLWARLALASAPIVWLISRQLLRNRYYQQFGRVAEPVPSSDRRMHKGMIIFTGVVAAGVISFVLYVARDEPALLLDNGMPGYIAFVAAMPVIVWRYLHTPLDFIVGVFLIAQAALVLTGSGYPLGHQIQAPIAAVFFIGIGIRQHLDFTRLRRELSQLGVSS